MDGLIGAGFVGHDELGLEGIEATLDAFDGSVEGFEVNGDVTLGHRYIIAK